MRVAFLAIDDATADIVRAVLENYTLAGFCELDTPGQAPPPSLQPFVDRARLFDSWEALLDRHRVDAVVVARSEDEDRRAEQLRKLIQADVPLLVAHPIVESMLIYYELDMIRRDSECVIMPYLPRRYHAAIQELAEMVARGSEGPIGSIEQILVQSCVAPPEKVNIITQFGRDVDLIRCVAGEMTRLGAMGGAHQDTAYGSVGVQMSGPSGIAARWSVDPILSGGGTHITLLGAKGKAVVTISAAADRWTMAVTSGGDTETREYPAWNPADAALKELAAAAEGQPATPDWVEAARSVELAETIERSLQKGRTIELHFEEYTEEGTFKGTMTSLGCGLLVAGTFLLGAVAIAEQMGLPFVRRWPWLLLGIFGFFLFMQLLVLAARRRTQPQPQETMPSEKAESLR